MKFKFGQSHHTEKGENSVESTHSELTQQVRELEEVVHELRREAAALRVELFGLSARQSASVSLFEQRVDQIYRKIASELSKDFRQSNIVVEKEADVDQKLLEIFSAGFDEPVDPRNLRLRDAISGTISSGSIEGPLTLYGFRINRMIARERGTHVYVNATDSGIAIYGPYKRLTTGSYSASFNVFKIEDKTAGHYTGEVAIDIYSQSAGKVIAEKSLPINLLHDKLTVNFDWGALEASGTVEIRLHQRSTCSLRVDSVAVIKS